MYIVLSSFALHLKNSAEVPQWEISVCCPIHVEVSMHVFVHIPSVKRELKYCCWIGCVGEERRRRARKRRRERAGREERPDSSLKWSGGGSYIQEWWWWWLGGGSHIRDASFMLFVSLGNPSPVLSTFLQNSQFYHSLYTLCSPPWVFHLHRISCSHRMFSLPYIVWESETGIVGKLLEQR